MKLCLLLTVAPCLAQAAPTPPSVPTPRPTTTPRALSLELYFRRPAKIIPWFNDREKLEIAEEVPWLTADDFNFISAVTENNRALLRVNLNLDGNQKYREALMGNIGRTVIFTVDGMARNTFKMVPVERKNKLFLAGDFTPEEAEAIAASFQPRLSPSPTPETTPTPSSRTSVILD